MTVPKIKKWHFRCGACHGDKLQATSWYYINTGEDAGGDPPLDDVWCDDCESEVDTHLIIEYEDGKFALDGQPDRLFDTIEEAVGKNGEEEPCSPA